MARFSEFFRIALTGSVKGDLEPYDYQKRRACGDRAGRPDADWLASPTPCQSQLIDIPTGLGKTAGVVLAWLWNRVILPNQQSAVRDPQSNWPCRLVYCLPMRTLVEQTRENVKEWLRNVASEFGDNDDLRWLAQNSPVILMGGEEADSGQAQWDLYPEMPAILIGTQDMLLSRALNRGYGMSRYRWPMHFGLLNNDCLWVLDETQLMGVGIETSAQLEGFRGKQLMGAARPNFTWWMSATLDESQLQTVDARMPESRQELSAEERETDAVQRRLQAEKRLAKAPVSLALMTDKEVEAYTKALAGWLLERHQPSSLTLVVVNRVDRAQRIYQQLLAADLDNIRLALVHSRLRPCDREAQQRILTEETGSRIVIATQAVEAGVDVSARTLVTELAPWSSLVQRFGRCHRYGEIAGGADVFWIDLEAADDKFAAPYTVADLNAARTALTPLDYASPNDLAAVEVTAERPIRPVIRRKDLVDLTDTTPDLAGYDLDISRYVRDSEDADVQVYWRSIESGPDKTEPKPSREELVRVSVPAFNKLFRGKQKADRIWEWSHLDRGWRKLIGPATPGRVLMVEVSHGGYDDNLGWTGDKKHQPTPRPPGPKENRDDHDPLSDRDVVLDLAAHTANVRRHLEAILDAIALPDRHRQALETAANWHDIGKAHAVFQEAVQTDDRSRIWAKGKMTFPYKRPHFRHELASALAWLQERPDDGAEIENLVAYLIAAHHGKVRFSLRAMPGEPEERECDTGIPAGEPDSRAEMPAPQYFARGVWHCDTLGALEIPGTGQQLAEVALDLRLMRLGSGSWLERMIALRDDTETLGSFRLAFLETMLRAADMRASAEEADSPAES